MKRLLFLLPLLLILAACPQPPEQSARDAIAASKGAIQSAQAKYQDTCTKDPSQKPCVLVNKAVASQNATVTALSAYCNFTPTTSPEQKCKPVDSALPALQAATNNLNQFTNELTEALK